MTSHTKISKSPGYLTSIYGSLAYLEKKIFILKKLNTITIIYHDALPSILAVGSGERWTGFGGTPSSAASVLVCLYKYIHRMGGLPLTGMVWDEQVPKPFV